MHVAECLDSLVLLLSQSLVTTQPALSHDFYLIHITSLHSFLHFSSVERWPQSSLISPQHPRAKSYAASECDTPRSQ